jgi:hypothetical protein
MVGHGECEKYKDLGDFGRTAQRLNLRDLDIDRSVILKFIFEN